MADFRRIPRGTFSGNETRHLPRGTLDFVMYAAARQRRPDGLVSYLLWLAPHSEEEPANPDHAVVYAGISSYVDRVLVEFHIPDDGRVRDFDPPCLVHVGRQKGVLVLN